MGKTKIKTIDYSKPEEEKKVVDEKQSQSSVILEGAGRPIESEEKDAKNDHSQASLIASLQHDKTKKSQKPGKAKPRSKKYQEVAKLVDPTQKYNLEEAVKLAQGASYSKFDGTLEAHINTAVKNIRGLVSLPHLSGRALTILAFGKGAKEAGADVEGTEETITEIEKGKLKFDVLVTTPEWMPKLAKVAKILGPRGLMPNPKNGTITENLEKTIADLKGGKIEYKTESNGQVIHLSVGKTSQAPEEVAANIKVLYAVIGKSKIQKITLSPTMGPGVKVNLSSI